jgi:hypothetical protein
MSKGSLRDQMPEVTAWVDGLRKAFSVESIDGQIRAGINGKPTFWASENGHEIGTRDKSAKCVVGWDDKGIAFSVDIPAGVTFDEEMALLRTAREKANARIFCPKGLVVQGDANAG